MRCEDCLPLIEEYFDGEVTGQTEERIGAHLAACADCSAALDALSFEQEVYARYDRGGLEVSPDLWARVSAEIARTVPPSESPAAGRPFLSRARASFAAALGALALRPALASSLALLFVAAAAGTLWLSRRTQPTGPVQEVARKETPVQPAVVNQTTPAVEEAGDNPRSMKPMNNGVQAPVPVVYEAHEPPREAAVALNASAPRPERGAGIDVPRLLNNSSEPKDDDILKFPHEEAAASDDEQGLFVKASGPAGDLVATGGRQLDPEQKDVARHVERAQMLLRSIKNARASDAGEPDFAYEKQLSRKLLAENATLQLDAEVKGDKESKQVLDRIEPFLLEIANMGEKPSREEVRSIRERVKQNEIVAALEVY